MCATCVAQGVAYVGGALAGLQVMAARAAAKRRRDEDEGGRKTTTAGDEAIDRSGGAGIARA
jgi:hypothetical protein